MDLLILFHSAPGGGVRKGAAWRWMALALMLAAIRAHAADGLEYAVKANYLYKFAPYVDWPDAAFSSASSPINLCVAGDDPFGTALDAAVGGQRVANRDVVVRRLKSVGRDSGCHILFVGGADPQRVAQVLAAVRGSPVLTVTDLPDAAGSGAIVNFVIKDNRVRFDIDEEAAAHNGIAVSSRLLSLALNIRRRPSREVR